MVRNLSALNWLKLDALNRAWRAALQGVAITVSAAVGDAVWQVCELAFLEAAEGRPMDWAEVGDTAWTAARFAAAYALASYLHRRVVDPSRVPSATPPAPPATLPDVAQAGAMNAGTVRA